MSWYMTVGPVLKDEFVGAVTALTLPTQTYTVEHADQLAQAKAAAIALVLSGALGTGEGLYGCTLSGHAPAGHAFAGNETMESIGVTVTRHTPPAATHVEAATAS